MTVADGTPAPAPAPVPVYTPPSLNSLVLTVSQWRALRAGQQQIVTVAGKPVTIRLAAGTSGQKVRAVLPVSQLTASERATLTAKLNSNTLTLGTSDWEVLQSKAPSANSVRISANGMIYTLHGPAAGDFTLPFNLKVPNLRLADTKYRLFDPLKGITTLSAGDWLTLSTGSGSLVKTMGSLTYTLRKPSTSDARVTLRSVNVSFQGASASDLLKIRSAIQLDTLKNRFDNAIEGNFSLWQALNTRPASGAASSPVSIAVDGNTYSVRSVSVAMETISPTASLGAFLWMISRLVVFPDMPGP